MIKLLDSKSDTNIRYVPKKSKINSNEILNVNNRKKTKKALLKDLIEYNKVIGISTVDSQLFTQLPYKNFTY